jgi:hypothetical protein
MFICPKTTPLKVEDDKPKVDEHAHSLDLDQVLKFDDLSDYGF